MDKVTVNKQALEDLELAFRTARHSEFQNWVAHSVVLTTRQLIEARRAFKVATENFIDALRQE